MTAGTGLSIRDFSVGYRRRPVLSRISMPDLALGQMVAVLGGNGAGKSTFLKALSGYLKADGRAVFNGRDLVRMPSEERRSLVGYVPQTVPQESTLLAHEFAISALRASDPGLVGGEAERRVHLAFRSLGLLAHALDPVRVLSIGRRQLLGLAPVVARAPSLVLLDEPTSALDMSHELQVLQALRALADEGSRLCLVALHDINLALRFCDQVVFLANGGVAAAGPPAPTVTPSLLTRVYGVAARIETCSRGAPFVLADRALAESRTA